MSESRTSSADLFPDGVSLVTAETTTESDIWLAGPDVGGDTHEFSLVDSPVATTGQAPPTPPLAEPTNLDFEQGLAGTPVGWTTSVTGNQRAIARLSQDQPHGGRYRARLDLTTGGKLDLAFDPVPFVGPPEAPRPVRP